MNRSQYYQLAKLLANGNPPIPLGLRWNQAGSSKEYWEQRFMTLRLQREELTIRALAQVAREQLLAAQPVDRMEAVQALERQREAERLADIQETKAKRDALRTVIRKRKKRKAQMELLRNGITTSKTLKNGDKIITIRHIVPEYIRQRLTVFNMPTIMEQLVNVLNRNRNKISGNRFRVGVRDLRRNNNNYMSTPYLKGTLNEAAQALRVRHLGPYSRGNDSDQDNEGFDIGEITIYIYKSVNLFLGSSSRSLAQATRKWLIISPKTKYNCLFQSLAVCKNFGHNENLLKINKEGQKARVNSGKELKRCVKPSKDNYADGTSIQEACNYLRYPINLYNNIFEKIKTYKPENPLKRYRGMKEYDIRRVGIHCEALVPRNYITKKFPSFDFPELGEVKEHENEDETTEIKKRKCFDEYNPKFAAWDIETSKDCNNKHIPYASSIAWFEYEYGEPLKIKKNVKKVNAKTKKVTWVEKIIEKPNIIGRKFKEKQFWGLQCLKQMTKWIYVNKAIFNGYTLYAHNGGKYDLPLVIKRAFIDSDEFVIEGKGCIELNNAWIGFVLRAKHDNKFKIQFRDSLRLLPGGLEKLAKEFGVEHQKLTETVKHDDITLANWGSFPQLPKYLTHDVFGLLEIIEKFGKGVFNDLGIDITKCYTGASLSKKNFFKNYYKNEFKIFTLDSKTDKFVRDSYFGGRVECFKLGDIGKNYYYDFTSLYPDVGREYLPYGMPELIAMEGSKLPKDFFGWVRCKVRTKDRKAIPKHATLKDSRLVFPIFENWTEMNIFSKELDFDIYEYQFIEGVQFKKAKFKKRFFNDGFLKKAKAKSEGNFAMAQAYKIIINSGYGFWGLRTKDRDGVIIYEPGDDSYKKYLMTDKLTSIKEENGYVFCRVIKDLAIKDFNVAVAAAISSYARSKLHSLMTAIKKVGGQVFYSDTDSVICNINLEDYPEIRNKFQWDGDGTELGSLKNEADEKVEKLLKKLYPKDKSKRNKLFRDLVKKEKGNLSFDKGCITGCKQYALSKTVTIEGKEHTLEIVKIKGYSQKDDKLKYSDMQKLGNGEKLYQNQMQFRCPKSNYVSETKSFDINTRYVRKSFRMTYTKGQLFKPTGDVLPLRI